jgi:hypothetical protein
VVLAGHGAQVENEPVVPFAVPVQGRYSPALGSGGVAYAVPYTETASRALAAARALAIDPRDALADMTRLTDGRDDWILQRDLLSSNRFAPDYVAEPDDGTVHQRFGDDVSGRRPWRDNGLPRRTGPAAAPPGMSAGTCWPSPSRPCPA